VPLPAKLCADAIQVQAGIGGWVHGPRQIRRAAAVAAADLQHFSAGEIHLGCRAVIELDGKPIGLIGRCQLQGHRRVFFISVVEEQHIVSSEQSAEDSVTVFEAQIQDFQQDWVAVQPVDQSFGRSPLQTAIVSGATPAPW
jgi:hypothetical protein